MTPAAELLLAMEFTGYTFPDDSDEQKGLLKFRYIEVREYANREFKLYLTAKGRMEIPMIKEREGIK